MEEAAWVCDIVGSAITRQYLEFKHKYYVWQVRFFKLFIFQQGEVYAQCKERDRKAFQG